MATRVEDNGGISAWPHPWASPYVKKK